MVTTNQTVVVKNPYLMGLEFDGNLANKGGANLSMAWSSKPNYSAGVSGQAARFQPGSGFITVDDTRAQASGMKELTLSLDFNVDAGRGDGWLVYMPGSYGVKLVGRLLYFVLKTESSAKFIKIDISRALDGNWHSFTGTYDGGRGIAVLFLDGTSVRHDTSLTGRINPVRGRALTIGGAPTTSEFSGRIDNVRIFQGIVTPDNAANVLSQFDRSRKYPKSLNP